MDRDAIDDVIVDEEGLAHRRRRKRNIIIAVVAVALLAIAALFMMGGSGEKAAAPKADAGEQLPAVSVIVPGRQDIPALISATGSLAARRDMPVGVPGEGGQIERVLVEPGQWVAAGQTLAIINRSVQAQEASQLAAQIEVARADLRLAQNELDHAQALVGRGFVSQADLDRKRAARDTATARVRVAQATLGATRARIGRLDVRAPTAGLVLSRSVEAGQVVGAGSPALFRVAAGGEMELLARLPQSDLARLSVGVPVMVSRSARPRPIRAASGGLAGHRSMTRQGVARDLGSLQSRAPARRLRLGQIRAGSMNAPLLPKSAVQSDHRGNFVYIVDNQNKIARRDVRVGEVSDRGVAIAAGLNGNERIVESAGAFLSPGQRVRPERTRSAR